MNLIDLGYNDQFAKSRVENNLIGYEIGRVIAEHKERYIVWTEKGELESEITGNLRFTAKSREDFPAVGDWVALSVFDSGFSIIHKILPRYSMLSRQSVGSFGEVQVIAANIDFALLVQAVDRDLNFNRIERYLTICHSSKVDPIIVFTKIDLIDIQKKTEIIESLKQRIKNIPVFAISSETGEGYPQLKQVLEKGKTFCLLGSSGVGKSTLLNNLSGKTVMKTDSISQSTGKGRHVTSHRELTLLENGAILIDNPGMKEVGIVDEAGGLESTFEVIYNKADMCQFKDCKHLNEKGCAVIKAVYDGEIDSKSYENFLKMEREKSHFESSVFEKRKKDKQFGKMVKKYKKDMGQER
ncbi:MAG: ribosome small subunit-dependent GTPase A [Bacteroidetes bacterium GWF2_38_335]|nr:MAG: ribosome small subunit-dependent GTPase A [Bacteroidetes bacterium GWF2_38_335]HBS88207.1 ribosome small subunit-dependent GTPase A [Bacteroidales bacterium]